MRAHWEKLHASFGRAIRTLQANRAFADIREDHPELAPFNEPGAVIAYLASRDGNLDAKERVLATLIHLVQRQTHTALASSLLWLGLWPGLDAVYRRRLRHFDQRAEELVSALGDAFTGIVDRIELSSVRRVAATLVRSTERDIVFAAKRRWAEDKRPLVAFDVSHEWTSLEARHEALETRSWSFGLSPVLGLPPSQSLDGAIAALRTWLASVVGDDAELVMAVLVLEETQHAAGAQLGLSPQASRKRFQRALRRIRTRLEF